MKDEPKIDLAKLAALEAKATKGPWRWVREDASVVALYGPDGEFDHVLWSQICEACQEYGGICTSPNDDNADLIAEVRNALPELIRLARIGKAVEEVANLKAQTLGLTARFDPDQKDFLFTRP